MTQSENMQTILEERSLADRLLPRLAVEERFRRMGGKLKAKSFFRRHERTVVNPIVEAGLKISGFYDRARQEALSPVVTEVEMTFAGLPASFDGYRVLHLSDLHIDGVPGLHEIVADTLDGVEADLCLMTGDYRFEDEGPCDEVYRRMSYLIPRIRATHGVYGILGNHDEAEIAHELEDMGVHMLVNEAAEVSRARESVWIAGLDDDFDYECDDLQLALMDVPNGAFTILMAHTPELYDAAADSGIDLYLCGHTHGGQVRFPGIGALRSNVDCPRAYSYGQWRHAEMHGYTSGGIGCSSLPIRLNCPPELVLITMRSGRPEIL